MASGSHTRHSQLTENNENEVYAFAIACSSVRSHTQPYTWVDYTHLLLIPIILTVGLFGECRQSGNYFPTQKVINFQIKLKFPAMQSSGRLLI